MQQGIAIGEGEEEVVEDDMPGDVDDDLDNFLEVSQLDDDEDPAHTEPASGGGSDNPLDFLKGLRP